MCRLICTTFRIAIAGNNQRQKKWAFQAFGLWEGGLWLAGSL
jgi:hypothetical protein